MSKDIREVEYRVTGSDAGAVATFNRVKGAMGEAERVYAGLARTLAGGIAGGAVATVFGAMMRETREAEAIGLRFNAVLRATGNTAGQTRQQLEDMANELSGSTMFDDEAIKQAQTAFIKFQNIQGETFREGIRLAADYAALTGSDMASASQAVGRALQSPTQGLRALQMELGRLTPEQERHIMLLMQQGRLAEAQGVVLDFLRSKLAGTAQEMNQGLNGATAALTKNWNDMLKAMGRSGPGEIAANSMNNIATAMDAVRRLFDGGLLNNLKEYFFYTARLNGIYVSGHPGNGPVRTDAGWGGSPSAPAPRQLTEEQMKLAEKNAEDRKRLEAEVTKENRANLKAYYEDYATTAAWYMQRIGKEREEEQKRIDKFLEDSDEVEARRQDELRQREAEQGQIYLRQQKERIEANQRAEEHMLAERKRMREEDNQFAIQAARNLQSELGSVFYDVLDRRTDSIGERFSQMLKRMQAELLASQVNKFLFGNMANGAIGGVVGDWTSRIFNGGVPWGWDAGSPSGTMPPAPPVPQYATGVPFVPRDMLVMAHRGERIESAYQNNGRSGGVTVQLNFALGVANTVRAEVMNLLPQITAATASGVHDANRRSTSGSRA